jgi:hypothetical protein
MKTNLCPFLRTSLVLGVLACGITAVAFGAEPTAQALFKEGNRHVGEESRDRLVQIHSEKSIGTLVPNVWTIVYYDPDAPAKVVEIKFSAGKKVSVKRPGRVSELFSGEPREMPKARVKIDSDKALETAKREPLLKNISLKASKMKLERLSKTEETPVWKIELWAAKLKNPNLTVSVGEVFVNAEDGKVLRSDLKISHVD